MNVRASSGLFQKIKEKEKHLEEPVVYSGVKSMSRYHPPPLYIYIYINKIPSS